MVGGGEKPSTRTHLEVEAVVGEGPHPNLWRQADPPLAQAGSGTRSRDACGRGFDRNDLQGYAWLEREDVLACLTYARKIVAHDRVEPPFVNAGNEGGLGTKANARPLVSSRSLSIRKPLLVRCLHRIIADSRLLECRNRHTRVARATQAPLRVFLKCACDDFLMIVL